MPNALRNRRILFGSSAPAFSPLSIPGLALWLDASRLTLADNDPVTTWPDLSGNGRNATQATTSKKPTFRTNRINGRGAVITDGVDDWIRSSYGLTQSQPSTLCMVFKGPTYSGSTVYLFDAATAAARQLAFRSGITNLTLNAGNSVLLTNSHTALTLLTIVLNGASSLYRLNSVQTNTDLGATGTTGLTLGARHDEGSPGAAEYAEIVAVNGDAGSTMTSRLEAYLKAKWGTP